MPLTKSDMPNLLLAGLKSEFFRVYDSYMNDDYLKLATIAPSTKSAETYAWLGSNPAMREFIDERQVAGLLEHNYTITNKKWEATIGVDRAAIEDDQYGQIKLRAGQLAEMAAIHKRKIVMEALFAGTTQLCYDGQYFFDTDHVSGASGSQGNLGSTALSSAAIIATIILMRKFKDDKGNVMNVIPDTLVVPVDLEWVAKEIVMSTYVATGAAASPAGITGDNLIAGTIKNVIVSPYLTDTTNWYLLDTSHVIKPLILQERTPVEFTAMEGNTDTGFNRDEYRYGARARYNVGFGMWQYGYAHIVSGA